MAIALLALGSGCGNMEDRQVRANAISKGTEAGLVAVQAPPPELSGCAVVEGGVLVVEDEAIGAVLFCPDTAARPLPLRSVKLERKKKDRAPFADRDKLFPVQDFEDIASDGRREVFFIGSHNGKDGERRPDREFLIQAKWSPKDAELKVSGEAYNLLDRLAPALEEKGVPLGLTRENVVDALNFEGLAYHDGRLFIGLRGPLAPTGGALICVVDAEAAFGGNGPLNADILVLDLRGAGIRALDWDPVENTLLVISGPSVDGGGGPVALWRCDAKGGGLVEVHAFDPAVARKKPEGVCRLPADQGGNLMVVLDGDGESHVSEVLFLPG
ncbi:MAG: DUF3616 domain-containing protein [Candidatus Hydrogenedentes bacterium]|nr:DUF3616 domain-containing protein [Candidatus Hydrogenedentota bacterium]